MKCSGCSSPIKPVVAVDVDGTLGDYHGHLLWFAEQWLGVTPTGWSIRYRGNQTLASFMGIDAATYRTMKLAYRQGGMKRMMPAFLGAAELIHTLRNAGAEVWITTTRPYNRYDSTDPDTREWLRRNGIHFDYLLYDDHKYQRLTELVDHERIVGVLDDLPDQYDQAVACDLRPILRRTRYNAALSRPLVAASLEEAGVQLLDQISRWNTAHS